MGYSVRAMPARTRLAQYVLDRITAGGETPEEFAERIGINVSGLYKFLRGVYAEPRQRTLDKIAAGLHMTPADLLIVTGKGDSTDSPRLLTLVSRLRGLPDRDLAFIERLLSGFSADPSSELDARVDKIYQEQHRSSVMSTRLGATFAVAGVA